MSRLRQWGAGSRCWSRRRRGACCVRRVFGGIGSSCDENIAEHRFDAGVPGAHVVALSFGHDHIPVVDIGQALGEVQSQSPHHEG